MALHISVAQPSDLDTCAQLLAEAFLSDDVFRLVIRGDRRQRRLQEYFASSLLSSSLPAGTLDVARQGPNGEIVGVAEWQAPNPPFLNRVRTVRHRPRLLRAIGVRNLPSVAHTLRAFQRFTPGLPHWYLAHLGVSDRARGLGVGTALLEHRLTAIDPLALPAYLAATSAASQRLYERFDFKPVGAIVLNPQLHATAMLRPIRPRGHAD